MNVSCGSAAPADRPLELPLNPGAPEPLVSGGKTQSEGPFTGVWQAFGSNPSNDRCPQQRAMRYQLWMTASSLQQTLFVAFSRKRPHSKGSVIGEFGCGQKIKLRFTQPHSKSMPVFQMHTSEE